MKCHIEIFNAILKLIKLFTYLHVYINNAPISINHRHLKNPVNSRFQKYPVLKDHHLLDSRNQLLKGRRDPRLLGLKAPLPQVIKEESLQLRNKKWVLVKVEIYVICAESNKTCKISQLVNSIVNRMKKFDKPCDCMFYPNVQGLSVTNTSNRRHNSLLLMLAYF